MRDFYVKDITCIFLLEVEVCKCLDFGDRFNFLLSDHKNIYKSVAGTLVLGSTVFLVLKYRS